MTHEPEVFVIIIAGNRKSIPQRFYANVIDYFVFISLVVIYIATFGDPVDDDTWRVTGLKAMMIPVGWFIYFCVMEGGFGQTLGKKALHLHVVKLDGRPPSVFESLARRLFDPLELCFFGLPGILMINGSSRNQRIGDMIAGTTVVRTEVTCRFCKAELELTPGEVIRDHFTCPNCREDN